MNSINVFKNKQPWRDALVATTGLALFVLASTMLWSSGHPEWAFALIFAATWTLLFISWSNIDYTDKSGTFLAKIVDHNFQHVNDRIEQLEKELEMIRND